MSPLHILIRSFQQYLVKIKTFETAYYVKSLVIFHLLLDLQNIYGMRNVSGHKPKSFYM
jgi:hypothetical protein